MGDQPVANWELLDPREVPGYLVLLTSAVDFLDHGRLERVLPSTGVLRRPVEGHAPADRRLFGLPP